MNWNFSVGKIFFFSVMHLYSTIDLHQCGPLIHILSLRLSCSIIFILLLKVFRFGHWECFLVGSCVHLTGLSNSRCFRFILYFSSPSSRISHFSWGPWFFFFLYWGMVFKLKSGQEMFIATVVLLFLGPFRRWS